MTSRASPEPYAVSLRVQKVLTALGNTPDEIAASLKSQGIRGAWRKDAYGADALAHYLKRETGMKACVGRTRTVMTIDKQMSVCVEHSQAVYDFVLAYDRGGFSELYNTQSTSPAEV